MEKAVPAADANRKFSVLLRAAREGLCRTAAGRPPLSFGKVGGQG
jgi:hypothetical protein